MKNIGTLKLYSQKIIKFAFWEVFVQFYKSLQHLNKSYHIYCTNFTPSLDSENRGRQIKRDKF